MTTKTQPECTRVQRWLTHNFGKGVCGALTGQDVRALTAAVHVLQLLAVADGFGRGHAVRAFASCVSAMQVHTRWLAFHAVAFVLDWQDRDGVWAEAALPWCAGMERRALEEPAGARNVQLVLLPGGTNG